MKNLLLHSCCAPCSTAVIERLLCEMPEYNILVFYYNPNIYPMSEYEKRKNEQIRYIGLLNSSRVTFIDADYESDLFEEKMKITPKQYILQKKLALADKLIGEGIPPTVAAGRVGYENYSNFYRMYSKYYGVRPTTRK